MNKEIDWKKIRKIFFVGIKGVGMMPLAIIAKEAGYVVEGSDLPEEFITDEVLRENNIKMHSGFEEGDIVNFFADDPIDSCLIITTGAHGGYNNPQVVKAKEMGVSFLNQGQALGIFMSGKPLGKKTREITITGSHGKTTISAMTAHAMSRLGFEPSYSVGTSKITSLGPSGHLGRGEFFIAEGDEYVGEPVFDRTPKILYQNPEFLIINNIDFDHPDIYSSLDDFKAVISKMINKVGSGKVFMNADDPNSIPLFINRSDDVQIITYGESDSDYKISEISDQVGVTTFTIHRKDNLLGKFSLKIPGIHNAKNSVPVIALLDMIGVGADDIENAVSSYAGCKRRMEEIGRTARGALIIDDYGHHPAEIKSTINALSKFYRKKIICVFQSHTYSRTRKFLEEFSNSFKDVEELILLPIFKSQRDTESDIISNEEFENAFKKNNKKVLMHNSIIDAVSYVNSKEFNDDYLILTIGAGDVYKVGYELKL